MEVTAPVNNKSINPSHVKFMTPFFIMGCQRSGTTLVARLLDTHSRIAVYLGTHYYPIFYPDCHRYGNFQKKNNLIRFIKDLQEIAHLQGVNPPDINEFLHELVAPTFEGVLTTLLNLYALKQGKIRSSDKTPEHYFYLRTILEHFPESPIIFTMRDPRDTILSTMKGMGTSLDGSIWAWDQAYKSYKQAKHRVKLVRYENLVMNPTETLKSMCSYLGEQYEPSILNFYKNTPDQYLARPHHYKLFIPIDTNSIGNFLELQDSDIRRIEAACAEGMEEMGYAFTSLDPKNLKIGVERKRGLFNSLIDRLRYYRLSKERWERGWFRWKMMVRVRVRYLFNLGPLRSDW